MRKRPDQLYPVSNSVSNPGTVTVEGGLITNLRRDGGRRRVE